MAKYNVAKHYAVVGTLDDMEGFFRALEGVLPQFFTGAAEL